ncbi:MAG: hypothetical protein Q7R93_04525 [bacterium]|nr:hypothetical protein [bacterium]
MKTHTTPVIKNLTGSRLTLVADEPLDVESRRHSSPKQLLELEPDAAEATIKFKQARGEIAGIPFESARVPTISGLPEPEPGVILLVSPGVHEYVKGRADVCCPAGLLKDARSKSKSERYFFTSLAFNEAPAVS